MKKHVANRKLSAPIRVNHPCPSASKKGFTLIELLVTMGVTAVLASFMIVYGSASRQQVALSVEDAKLAQIISRARSLSVSTFNDPTPPCGYGVHLDYVNQAYALVKYEVSPNCRAVYASQLIQIRSEVSMENYNVTNEVKMISSGASPLTDVFFVPPDPKVVSNVGGSISVQAGGTVTLQTQDGKGTRTITINPAGQITF